MYHFICFFGKKYKKKAGLKEPTSVLSYLDSNQDRQNQKLQCYHYTIRQSSVPKKRSRFLKRCKVTNFFPILPNFFS